MKKNLFFVAFGVLLSCALFFYFNTHKKEVNNSKHLKVSLCEGDPPTLHPHMAIDVRGRILGKSLFEGLTRLDDKKGSLAAAESVEIDPSGTRYVFKIRPHLWSNGEPVSAYHFEKAWKQAIHPNSLCSRVDLFYIIKNAKKIKRGQLLMSEAGIQALDEHTLLVELENPAPYFLELLSHPIFSPIFCEEAEPTIFNGPFKVGKWERDSVLELVKNDFYWDKKNVDLDKVSIFMIPDKQTGLALFEKKELDIVGDCFGSLALEALPMAMHNPYFKKQEISKIYWIYFNTAAFPFQSKKIRQAFSYALDRESMTKNFLIGDTSCSTILPRTLSLLQEKKVSDTKQLFEEGLEELGLTRETFPCVTLSYSTFGKQKSLSELLQARLQATLGIKVNLQSMEWNVLSEHLISGKFQLAGSLRNAMYEDPLYFLEIFKEKGNSYNFSQWENPLYKNLLNLAVQTSDVSDRESYLRQAEELLQEELPVMPVYMENCKYITQENIKGYYINHSGYADFKTISRS